MHPHAIAAIPEETVRVARAAFPRGNISLTMRDQLGTLYEDENFSILFPKRGRPAEARLPTRSGLCVPMCCACSLIGKRQKLFGAELTGNTHCSWI